MKLERRFLQTEIRSIDGGSPKIAGYAAKFNVRSQDLGGFVEIIAPGAFDACLAANPDILGLFNHDMNQVLGRTSSETMRVFVDGMGLQYEIDPPDTTLARDLMVSMKRKDIRGSSFGFYCLEEQWDYDSDPDLIIRTVLKANVFDCSVVMDPAYLSSDSSVRSQLAQYDEELKSRVAEKRATFRSSSTADVDDETRRRDFLLHLAR